MMPTVLLAAVMLAQVTPRPVQQPAAPLTPPSGGPTAAQQRLSYAQQAFGLAHSMYRQGNLSADAAATWSLRIYEAQKDSPNAAREHLDRMVALEKLATERVQAGSAPVLDKLTVSFFRAQAEQLAGKK